MKRKSVIMDAMNAVASNVIAPKAIRTINKQSAKTSAQSVIAIKSSCQKLA